MKFEIFEFLRDYSIEHRTEGSKHCQPGWVQIGCPFCTGNPGWHLGFNTSLSFWNCWRCGWHSNLEVVKTLTRKSWSEAKKLFREYRGRLMTDADYIRRIGQSSKGTKKYKELRLPAGTKPMTSRHRKYLTRRGFNPEEIEEVWQVQGTGPVGGYKHRIIAPIFYQGKLVSYQGRDITGKSDLKYKACRMDDEIMHHKNILYGIDQVQGRRGGLVEGYFDTWALGPGVVASFGITLKAEQVLLLSKIFNRLTLVFDNDPQAKDNAENLCYMLDSLQVETELIEMMEGDPAELNENEREKLKDIIFK